MAGAMKKAAAGATAVATAAALWWGTSTGTGKKPKPKPISADSLAALAHADSFPVLVARDTLGWRSGTLPAGDTAPLCALSRNRYTGAVLIVVPQDATLEQEAQLATMCERARQAYAAERAS
jgi:hypothetical protein